MCVTAAAAVSVTFLSTFNVFSSLVLFLVCASPPSLFSLILSVYTAIYSIKSTFIYLCFLTLRCAVYESAV